MNSSMIRRLVLTLVMLACVGLAATPAYAQNPAESEAYAEYAQDRPSAAAMAVDLFLVRPLGVIATVGGIGIFVLSLPFSILGGNVEAAAHTLIAEPGAYTFSRPLGDFG